MEIVERVAVFIFGMSMCGFGAFLLAIGVISMLIVVSGRI